MTQKQKQQIAAMKKEGLTIMTIAELTGLPLGTVKSYCHRNKNEILALNTTVFNGCCKYCGMPITPTPGKRVKQFCDRTCYNRWWHAQSNHPRMFYKRVCAHCGKTYGTLRKGQKYCSVACYQAARRAKIDDDFFIATSTETV